MTAAVVYAGLVMARVGAFVAVAPPFMGRTPRLTRVGFTMALTAFYLLSVAPPWDSALSTAAPAISPAVAAVSLLRESLIGAVLGLAFGIFFLPARIAGEFVTQQIGLAVSPQLSPTGQDAAGSLTNVFEAFATTLFLVADGHHAVLGVLHASFSRAPLGGGALPQADQLIGGMASSYEMGLLLAAPLALCLLLLAATLAVMARAAPQLNVYSVGFTLQVFVALVGGLVLAPDWSRTLLAIVSRAGDVLPQPLGW